MQKNPPLTKLSQQKQYRIIPSKFPPINLFEGVVDATELDELYEIESITNERMQHETGIPFLVREEDTVTGPGSSIVMAAFTHIHQPSRFTDGRYGIYYAGLSLETAIKETVFHREIFLKRTKEAAGEITMRVYVGNILKPLHDVRGKTYQSLHHHENYTAAQAFGSEMRESASWGIIYNSVRHEGGTCIAILRPPAVSIPQQSLHLGYVWNGEQITHVLEKKIVKTF